MADEEAGLTIVLASDHAGYDLKEVLAAHVHKAGYAVIDLGCHNKNSVDYPDMASLLATQMQNESHAKGILVCGTGIGISIAANRHDHIRCALCHDVTTAKLTREHNDANVIALGSRIVGENVAIDAVDAFIATNFEGGRHARRVDKLGAR